MKNILSTLLLLILSTSSVAVAQRPNVGSGGCFTDRNGDLICGQVPQPGPQNQPAQPEAEASPVVVQEPAPQHQPDCRCGGCGNQNGAEGGGFVGGDGVYINYGNFYPHRDHARPRNIFDWRVNRNRAGGAPGKRFGSLSATILRALWERGIVE